MKAVFHTRYGSPDVLEIREIEKPSPANNEILIKVHATTVNRTDCGLLRAKPFIIRFFTGLFKPKNPISGTEFAGVIEAVGENVTSFKSGDKVFGFNDEGLGSHAQYLTLSENKAVGTMPKEVSFEQATACLEGVHYAYNFINKVELKNNDFVLVNGASGGIGSAAVQLLSYYGVTITAVCDKKNIELVRSLGAARVIDYTKEDFTNDNQKYDYVFDAVGKSSFKKCKPLLKPKGVYISSELGKWLQNLFYALLTPIFSGKKVKFPYPANIKRSLLLVKKLIQEGKYKPVVDRQYPLEKVAEAFRYVEKGQKTGNVVIMIDG